MFSAPSMTQPHRSISERLSPTYQYHILSSWVLDFQKDTADLVDKVCRNVLEGTQFRNRNCCSLKQSQTVSYFAAEYLDLIKDPEGEFLLQRIGRIASWFALHSVECDSKGFEELKAVVETSLASLRSAKNQFRAIRAPLKESHSLGDLWDRMSFAKRTLLFDKAAYNQQVLACVHESGLFLRDEDDDDFQSFFGFDVVEVEKLEKTALLKDEEGGGLSGSHAASNGLSQGTESPKGKLTNCHLERLKPSYQYWVMKSAVTVFQKEISEIVNEICLKEVDLERGRSSDLPFIAVEYLDLVLEPKGVCLMSQIEKITAWLVEHSVTHDLRFGNLKAVVEMSLNAATKAKDTFRSLRAPKKEVKLGNLGILNYVLSRTSLEYDPESYEQQVMEILHAHRLQTLEADKQMNPEDTVKKMIPVRVIFENRAEDLPKPPGGNELKRYKGQVVFRCDVSEGLISSLEQRVSPPCSECFFTLEGV